MKGAKRLYFKNNLKLHKHDMKSTWKLMNDLNLPHCRSRSYVNEVKIYRREIRPVKWPKHLILTFGMSVVILQTKYLAL